MSREVWGDHDNVIKVDQQCLPVEAAEDLFNKSLKDGRTEVNLNDNTFHFQSLSCVMNAALSWVLGLRGTCQYSLSKSSVLKYLLLARASKDSSMRGRE